MSNKLPNARECLDKYPDLVNALCKILRRSEVTGVMEEYATIKCEPLKEENERLHDKLIDLEAVLLGLLDGNLCSAAGDDVIKQALK